MDLDSKHLTPATFLRHRHLNLPGILGSGDHVISRPQVLHCTLLRRRPTSLRNCKAKPSSQKRYVRKSLFGSVHDVTHTHTHIYTSPTACKVMACIYISSFFREHPAINCGAEASIFLNFIFSFFGTSSMFSHIHYMNVNLVDLKTNVKVKFILEQVTWDQRESRGIVPPFR